MIIKANRLKGLQADLEQSILAIQHQHERYQALHTKYLELLNENSRLRANEAAGRGRNE